MNIKVTALLAAALSLNAVVFAAQASDKQYSCLVEDSSGGVLADTSLPKSTTPMQSQTYVIAAADRGSAEAAAKAKANAQHGNKAAYVDCQEFGTGGSTKL